MQQEERAPEHQWLECMSYSDVEHYMSLSRNSIRRLLEPGQITAVKVGASVLIWCDDLYGYMQRHTW